MTYTVIWRPRAEADLGRIWLNARDRHEVSSAANEIDSSSRVSPETYGESRSGNTRIVVLPPLAVHFDVLPDDRTVLVLAVRYVATA